MPRGFSLMLIVSLALHLVLVLALTLGHIRPGPSRLATRPASSPPSLILLGSENIADLRQPSLGHPRGSLLSTSTGAGPHAAASSARAEKTAAATDTPAPMLALEANARAHLRDLPLEPILAPRHLPRLDGSNATVFVLDISGSMYEPYGTTTRLSMGREALALRVHALKDGTPFAVVLYGERSRTSGPLVAASDLTRDAAILFLYREASCGGGTNLPDGLVWTQLLQPGNIVLASDGELNLSLPDLLSEARQILGEKGRGPALTVIGIAPRPDSSDGDLLENLAEQQGGTYQVDSAQGEEILTASRTRVTLP